MILKKNQYCDQNALQIKKFRKKIKSEAKKCLKKKKM